MQFTNEENLLNTVLTAPIGICIVDANTLIAEVLNDKFLEVAGKPREAIAGKYYWDSFADVKSSYKDALATVVATGETFNANEVGLTLTRDGREESIFVSFVYTPVKDDAGKVSKVAIWVFEHTRQVNEREKQGMAKAALQRERDRLRDFFMLAPAGICILSGPQLAFELVNPVYQQLLPGRELLGRPIFEALPELQATPLKQILLDVYRTGDPYEIDELLIPLAVQEGGLTQNRFFSFSYQARRDENEEIDGILTVVFEVTDMVTERQDQLAINEELAAMNEEYLTTNDELMQTQLAFQQKNEALTESESRLQMAIETTGLGAWDHRMIEDELFLSVEGYTIFGLVEGAPIDFTGLLSLIYHEDNAVVWQAIRKALADDEHYDVTCRITRANDGAKRWIRVRGKVHLNGAGLGERNVATLLDITENKLAEEKSLRLAAIVESSDDAIISKTLDSVITSWNYSAERMFGYTADEIVGHTVYKLIPEGRYDEEPKILARLRTGERVEHFETKRLTKDGRELDVSLTISPMKDNTGRIIGLSKIMRDVTESKQNESRKNDFIGMVSHELKTPLTSLTAIIQVADQKLRNTEDKFLAGAMAKANLQVKRMSSMINGFLNISRLESGKMLVEKENFELDELISEIIEETKLTVSSHDIVFDNCDPVTIRADRDKISSVISNLLSNAIKYSPKGKYIELNCTVSKGEARVSVQDNGMGIKPNDLTQIFDRYYRVQSEHTRHISGFGIGLYLSAEIIKRHEGHIWAESESGIGSVFYFSLPLK